MSTDGQPDELLTDDAMMAATRHARLAPAVADAAAAVGLPRSVVHALGVAAEAVDLARAGYAPMSAEIDAIAEALQPIIQRAAAMRGA